MEKKDLYLLLIPGGLLVMFWLMKKKTVTPTTAETVRSQGLSSLIGAGTGLITKFLDTAIGYFSSSQPDFNIDLSAYTPAPASGYGSDVSDFFSSAFSETSYT